MNAGAYNRKIQIVEAVYAASPSAFLSNDQPTNFKPVLTCYARVKTTRGMTLIASGSDFEKAYTNFTIRYPKTKISRRMHVLYAGRIYSIEYLNNVDEANVELEMQCLEVTQ